MKKRIITVLMSLLIATALCACGKETTTESKKTVESNKDTTEEKKSSTIKEVTKQKMSKYSVDKAHIEKFNKKWRSSENWNPLFEKRCFYLNGVKAYMPSTPREYQELFDTEFVEAYMYAKGAIDNTCNITFQDKDGNQCNLCIWGEYTEIPTDSQELLEFSLDKEINKIDNTEYSNDFFTINNVTFEDVTDGINEYGYYFSYNSYFYIPIEILAYCNYINGTLPVEMQGEDCITFSELCSVVEETGGLQYDIADITADGISEIIFLVDTYIVGLTFDKQNNEIKSIINDYYNGTIFQHNICKNFEGNILEDYEYATYGLYNTNGDYVFLASQECHINEETRSKEYYVNNKLTTKEEYDQVAERYDIPRNMESAFSVYSYESMIYSLNTEATVYYDLQEEFNKIKDHPRYQPYENGKVNLSSNVIVDDVNHIFTDEQIESIIEDMERLRQVNMTNVTIHIDSEIEYCKKIDGVLESSKEDNGGTPIVYVVIECDQGIYDGYALVEEACIAGFIG